MFLHLAVALHEGLTMDESRRMELLGFLKEVIQRNTPSKWVRHQLKDIHRLHHA